MDVSKLPRLSKTATPGEPPPPSAVPGAVAPETEYRDRDGGSPGIGAEIWLSAILGIVFMMIGMQFARWALTEASGGTYSTELTWGAPVPGQPGQHPEGSPITYWQLPGFTALQDMALFLFGLAMMLEAIVLLAIHNRFLAHRPLVVLALTITITATLLNLILSAKLFAAGIIPLMSMLAVAFGGYIAAYEWKLLKPATRQHARA